MNFDPSLKHCLDAAACSTAAASFVMPIPPLATVMTVIYLGIRIYETKTVQRLLGKAPKGAGYDE